MKLGLKLWSQNTDKYLYEAVKLFENETYDYIELYVVPQTIEHLSKWKIIKTNHNIPFTLHAPHFMQGVNLADREKEKHNLNIFEEVKQFSEELNAEYIVVHGGIEGNIDETVNQLSKIKIDNLLIENKPFVAPKANKKICRGATIEEISKVIKEAGCGFCLDVGHAICTYNSLKRQNLAPGSSPYEYIKEFNALCPVCYHLSDNFMDSELDAHLNFGQGNYDFKKIFDIIDTNKNMAIETNRNSEENLDDFIEDVKWLRNL